MKAEDSAHLRTNRSLSVELLGQAANYHETPKKNRPDYALDRGGTRFRVARWLYIRNGVLSSACLLSRRETKHPGDVSHIVAARRSVGLIDRPGMLGDKVQISVGVWSGMGTGAHSTLS